MSEEKSKKQLLRCSFCGKSEKETHRMIQGPAGVRICDECVRLCMEIVEDGYEAEQHEFDTPDEIPTPHEIRAVLDQYVIGQDEAKVALSVAVYNHYKRIFFGGGDDVELQKSNILLLGPTGSGKTLFAQTLARILKVPFAIADATTLTEAGYVGDDVENILLRLLQAADYDVELAERGIIYVDELDKIQINTRNILFICGGAFEGLDKIIEGRLDRKSIGFDAVIEGRKEKDHAKILREVQPHDILKFGIIPELVGRLPVIAALDELRRDDLVRILTEPKNALVKQYQKLLSYDGAELVFDHDALEEIADKAIERKIGARGLRAVMEGLLTKVMYDIPSDRTIDRVTITRDCVDGKEPPQLGHRKEALQEGKPAAELPPVEPAS